MNRTTFFSIIIPCYNQAHFLNETLASVLQQTYENWECLIIDDGSTDDSRAKGEEWQIKDSRFKVFSKKNGGLSNARNYGIERAQGEYLIFLDSDDIIYSKYLEKATEKLTTSKIEVLISGQRFLNTNLSEVLSEFQPAVNRKNFLKLLSYNPIACVHAYIVSRKLLQRTGVFDEQLYSCEDWDLWVRAAKLSAKVATLRYIGAGYRMTSGSMSRNVNTFMISNIEIAERIRKIDNRISDNQIVSDEPIEPVLINFLLTNCGTLIFSGQLQQAKELFKTIVSNYKLVPSGADFISLYSYLTYTEKNDYKSRLEKWTSNLSSLSEFLLFCEHYLEKEGIYSTAMTNLVFRQLQPVDIGAFIPYIRTKDWAWITLNALPSKLMRTLKL